MKRLLTVALAFACSLCAATTTISDSVSGLNTLTGDTITAISISYGSFIGTDGTSVTAGSSNPTLTGSNFSVALTPNAMTAGVYTVTYTSATHTYTETWTVPIALASLGMSQLRSSGALLTRNDAVTYSLPVYLPIPGVNASKIQGRSVAVTAPSDAQALVWSTANQDWEPGAVSGSGGTWGTITGTLSSQTDLNTALNNKLTAASNLSDVGSKATSFNNLSPFTTAGDMLYGGISGAGTRLAAGTTTQVLHSGTSPSWSALSLANDVVGNLDPSHLNSGTGANAGTYWRGDGSWAGVTATPAGTSGAVQFNNGGATAGDATNFAYNNTTHALTVTGALTSNGITSSSAAAGTLTLNGSTSGSAQVTVAAVAGTPNPLQLPTASGSSGQVLKTDGANPQQLSWLTLAASATSDTTSATNITSGTLNAARLPTSAVQNNQANTFSTGLQDLTSALFRPPNGASNPATCSVGQVFYNTAATAGQNWYFCTATNTWTQQLNGGGGTAFSGISGGTNTTAAMVVGSGATLGVSGTGTINSTTYKGASIPRMINATFDGGGSALTSGKTYYTSLPFACTISRWAIQVDTGTATVDVWKIASGTAIPTVTNTITASASPAISTGTAVTSTTLTGWTTSVTANDIFGVNLKTVASATQVNFQLECDE